MLSLASFPLRKVSLFLPLRRVQSSYRVLGLTQEVQKILKKDMLEVVKEVL